MTRRGRRRFTLGLGAAVATLAVARPALAAGRVSVAVQLEQDRAQVGARITYIVTVTVEGPGDPPEPVLPAALGDAFRIEGPFTGTSFRSSFVNGRTTRQASVKHTYTITPLKPGEYRLGAHIVDDDGSRLSSNEPLLLVSGEALPTRTIQEDGNLPTVARGDVFVWGVADKAEVYVGEQVIYALDVYERSRFMNISLRTLPTFKDFWTEELPVGERSSRLVAGVPYKVHPAISRALFPQRAGTLTVGAAEVTVGLRRRVTGEATSVLVKPLPAEGQPGDFSPNNVGNYSIEASVDRTRVEQGQPLTLTVTIDGTGNVRVVEPVAWPVIDGVRRYDPKSEVDVEVRADPEGRPVVGGTRTYEFLLIPERSGKVTIPPHVLQFFEPSTGRYQSVQTDPIDIDVATGAGAGPAETPPAPEIPDEAPEGGELLPVIGGDSLPRHTPRQRWLTPRRWVVGMATVPGVLLTAVAGRFIARRLGGDEIARRTAATRARRRQLVDDARAEVDTGTGFHGIVAQLLHDVAVERAGTDGVGLSRPDLIQLLANKGVEPADLDRLERLLDRCDAARFGAEEGSAAARRKLLDEALGLLRGSSLGKGLV